MANKVTLRVAHSTKCANKNLTALTSVGRGSGCTCSPSYHTYHWFHGKPHKGTRVTDRAVAERLLTKTQFELDEGRAGFERRARYSFSQWAEEYLAQVERRIARGELKPRTLSAYRETIEVAKTSFGDVELRELASNGYVRTFYESLPPMTATSRDRHLRQLSACLTVAVDDERLDRNPVPAFRKKLRFVKPKRGKAPFEDGELARLWLAFDDPVALVAAQFSCETGLRLGEIVALEWPNVDLVNGTVYVEWTWDEKHGLLVAPKDKEPRTIYLTPEARAVLEGWVGVHGVHADGPVFSEDGTRLQPHILQRALVRAMGSAGIPRIHPELRLPRSFHSLRYTTSVLMQRRGYHPRLIEQTLGHGSLELSYGTYGAWSPAMLAAEAKQR